MSYQSLPEAARRRYIAYGLVIDSTLALRGALAATGAAAARAHADIEIRTGAIPADLVVEKQVGPYSWCPGKIIFDMPSVGRYYCDGGRAMTVEPAQGAASRSVEDMLIATALPVLLWMRDQVILHASCLQLPGFPAAIALSGPSGIGKSTLLQQGYLGGARIVGDDTIALHGHEDGVTASGLPGLIQGAGATAVARDRALNEAPLGAVFFLSRTPSLNNLSFSELTGAGALQAMLGQRHRNRVLGLLGKEAAVFKAIAAMVSGPAFRIFTWHKRDGDASLRNEEMAFIEAVLTS